MLIRHQGLTLKTLIGVVTLLLMAASAALHAQASLPQNSLLQEPLQHNQSSTKQLLGAQDNEFLPVEEAFRLNTQLDQGRLLLNWDIEPNYYLYKARFKLSADPQPQDFTPQFGTNTREIYDEYFETDMEVYYEQARIRIELPTRTEPFTLRLESQGCADAGLCYPPQTQHLAVNPQSGSVSLAMAAGPDSGSSGPLAGAGAETRAQMWLPYILLMALLGGMILNLMPCVFPVLSIKVMSLTQADPGRLGRHGWAYTLGVVLSFLVFAGVLMLARAGGQAVGWGFQLQSPLLIAALAYLFFVLGLSLSGMLSIGSRWMGLGQRLTERGGLSGSFFTGVLAALVASPCTAPFMGVAVGFALTQSVLTSLSVFAALGLGMALPLLLLCHLPGLAHRLPKPGAWMDTFKQAMAFPLYLTAIWLLWVLGQQAGINAVAALCTGALLILFALWLSRHRPVGVIGHRALKLSIGLAGLAALALPWQAIEQRGDSPRWQTYSPGNLERARAQGQPVFINLTAAWCITCLANERVTLNTERVQTAFEQAGVIQLKGDWTNYDPQITQLLEEYGRSGVPLYLWFPARESGPGQILPQLLRQHHLLELVENQTSPNLVQN